MPIRSLALSMLLIAGTQAALADAAQLSAADVQAQLRAALGPFGGAASPPEKQVRVTQEGDHLQIAFPLFALMGMTPADPAQESAMIATARQIEGRWSVERLDSPSQAAFVVRSLDGTGVGRMTVSRGDQNGHAVFDPTFATASSMSMTVRKVETESVMGDVRQAQHIDSYTLQAGLTPNGAGRLDFDQTLTASDIAVAMQLPQHKTVEIAIERGSFASKLDQLNKDRVGSLAAVVARLFGGAMAAASTGGESVKSPSLDPEAVREFAVLDDLAVGGKVDESADNIRVVADGKRGSADHASFSFGAAAPSGDLTAYLDVVVDGLALPDSPEISAYVPRHAALRPSVSGLDMHALTELIRSAAAADADESTLAMQAIGLLASGKLRIGIDSFAFDLGDAKFGGTAAVKVRAPTPQGVDGTARLTAENFESFIKQMQAQAGAQPHIADIMPGLIYAKGLARNEDGKLVWNVAYTAGKLTVNGVDPSGKPGGKQSGQPARR